MSDIWSWRICGGVALFFGVCITLFYAGWIRGAYFGGGFTSFSNFLVAGFPFHLIGGSFCWLGWFLYSKDQMRWRSRLGWTLLLLCASYLSVHVLCSIEEQGFLDRHAGIGGRGNMVHGLT